MLLEFLLDNFLFISYILVIGLSIWLGIIRNKTDKELEEELDEETLSFIRDMVITSGMSKADKEKYFNLEDEERAVAYESICIARKLGLKYRFDGHVNSDEIIQKSHEIEKNTRKVERDILIMEIEEARVKEERRKKAREYNSLSEQQKAAIGDVTSYIAAGYTLEDFDFDFDVDFD